jgi:tetratricopeptide (TPR) repeat protein
VLERIDVLSIRLEALVPERDAGPYHAEIDEAKHFVEKGDYQLARFILTKLRERAWDRLDAPCKFRVLSNMGAAHLGESQYEKAAALFFEAKSLQPDDERACANEALAYQLLDNPQRAFEIASQNRVRFPNSAKVAAVWVRNAPQTTSFKDLQNQLSDNLVNDTEVSFSLAMRAANEGALSEAEILALTATKLNSDWAYPWLLLAKVTIKKQMAKELGEHSLLPSGFAVAGLEKAEEYSEKAVELSKKAGVKGVIAEALMARGLIRAALGKGPLRANIAETHPVSLITE